MAIDLNPIIESLLFVAEDPISLEHFKKILDAETREIRAALANLKAE